MPKRKQTKPLTAEDLARGFRTYVIAAAAWLHKDPKQTAYDLTQEANLARAIEAIDELAEMQRKIAGDVVRSMVEDQLALAIKAKDAQSPAVAEATRIHQAAKLDLDRRHAEGVLSDAEVRDCRLHIDKKLREVLDKDWRTTDGVMNRETMPRRNELRHGEGTELPQTDLPARVPQDWRRLDAIFRDQEPLARVLRVGHFVYCQLVHGRAQVLDAALAAEMSAAAGKLRRPCDAIESVRPAAVAGAMVEDLLDGAGNLRELLAANVELEDRNLRLVALETKVYRRKKRRHPDRWGTEDAGADARYFGAFRDELRDDPQPRGLQAVSSNRPAAAAAEFVAAVVGGDLELAQAIANIDQAADLWAHASLGRSASGEVDNYNAALCLAVAEAAMDLSRSDQVRSGVALGDERTACDGLPASDGTGRA